MDTDVITPPWYHPDEYFLGFIPEGIGRRVSLEKRIIRRIVGRQDRSIRIYAGADREECYSKDFYRNIYFYLHIDFVIEGLTQGAYFRLCMHDKDRGEINEENEFNYYPGFFYPPMRGHHLYYAGVVRKLKHLAKKSKLPLYYVGWYYHEFQTFTKQFGFRLANLPENERVKKTIRRGEEVLIRRGLKERILMSG